MRNIKSHVTEPTLSKTEFKKVILTVHIQMLVSMVHHVHDFTLKTTTFN